MAPRSWRTSASPRCCCWTSLTQTSSTVDPVDYMERGTVHRQAGHAADLSTRWAAWRSSSSRGDPRSITSRCCRSCWPMSPTSRRRCSRCAPTARSSSQRWWTRCWPSSTRGQLALEEVWIARPPRRCPGRRDAGRVRAMQVLAGVARLGHGGAAAERPGEPGAAALYHGGATPARAGSSSRRAGGRRGPGAQHHHRAQRRGVAGRLGVKLRVTARDRAGLTVPGTRRAVGSSAVSVATVTDSDAGPRCCEGEAAIIALVDGVREPRCRSGCEPGRRWRRRRADGAGNWRRTPGGERPPRRMALLALDQARTPCSAAAWCGGEGKLDPADRPAFTRSFNLMVLAEGQARIEARVEEHRQLVLVEVRCSSSRGP